MAFSIKGQMKSSDDDGTPPPTVRSRMASGLRPSTKNGPGPYKPAVLDRFVFRDPHNTPKAPTAFANTSERMSWVSDKYLNLDSRQMRETIGTQRDRRRGNQPVDTATQPEPGAKPRPHGGTMWKTGDVVPHETLASPYGPRSKFTPKSTDLAHNGDGVPLDQPGIGGRTKDIVPTGRQGVPHWSEGGPLFPPGNPPLEPGRPQVGTVLQGEITFRRPTQQESRAGSFEADGIPDRMQIGPAPMKQIGPGRRPGSGDETPVGRSELRPRPSFTPLQGAKKVPGGTQGTLFSAREAAQGTLFRGRGPR